MKYEELSRALEFLDEDLLLEADAARSGSLKKSIVKQRSKERPRWFRFVTSAACILLSVSVFVTTLLMGIQHGFYLPPLDSTENPGGNHGNSGFWGGFHDEEDFELKGLEPVSVSRKKEQQMHALADQLFADVPWNEGYGAIYSYVLAHDYIVSRNDSFLAGEELWNAFYEETHQEKTGTVKIAECFEESGCDVKVFIKLLHFDGKRYMSMEVELKSNEITYRTVEGYRYLIKYEGTAENAYGEYDYQEYYLSNDDSITLEEIDRHNFRGFMEPVMPYFPVLEKYIYTKENYITLQVNRETECFEVRYPDGTRESYPIKNIYKIAYDRTRLMDVDAFFDTFFDQPLRLLPYEPYKESCTTSLKIYSSDDFDMNFYYDLSGRLFFKSKTGEIYRSNYSRFEREIVSTVTIANQ